MYIHQASREAGVPASRIRYYDELGLLGEVRRSDAGYRVFDQRTVRRLVILRKARDLGFSLAECEELLELISDSDHMNRDNIARRRRIAHRRLGELDREIAALQLARDRIQRLCELATEHEAMLPESHRTQPSGRIPCAENPKPSSHLKVKLTGPGGV